MGCTAQDTQDSASGSRGMVEEGEEDKGKDSCNNKGSKWSMDKGRKKRDKDFVHGLVLVLVLVYEIQKEKVVVLELEKTVLKEEEEKQPPNPCPQLLVAVHWLPFGNVLWLP